MDERLRFTFNRQNVALQGAKIRRRQISASLMQKKWTATLQKNEQAQVMG